ncbi:glycosyltransferase family 39 protein [Streptomyces sp. A3M-1-3]|uniref:glycosyltransferase family 39 protein n=1 Tax=Streptomyces sp. A3M-1-3 TaxID=2962044 RepID=UPI0020B6FD10|nr:glycosyltransferase family 39 protein [Streptomyces sp. A3M-1-3]MCP3820333.1 glycosyltransferase family 39 protein [Streptomyces sp. A3M-1-3]
MPSNVERLRRAPDRSRNCPSQESVISTTLNVAPAVAAERPAWTSRTTAALVPLVVTLVLGLWGIRREGSVWRDEVVTYDMAHRTLPDLWNTLQNADAVHGLYYFLMHGLFAVFGGDVTTLRLPSVLATAAAAAGIGLLGHQFAGPRAGLFAGLVFPLIPAVQEYAQEGRSYAVVCALVTWATCLLVRAASQPTRRLWIAYAAVALTACLLHEFAVLMLTAHGATMLFSGVPRSVKRSWVRAAACVVAGLAPLALFSMSQSEQVSWIMWPDPIQLLSFAAMAAVGLWCARTPVRSSGPIRLRTLALPLLILPTVVLLLASQLRPMYVERYVLYYVIGFALLMGAALDRAFRPPSRLDQTSRRMWVWSLSVAAVLVSLVPVAVHLRSPESRVDDAAAVALAVREAAEPGDGLLFTPARRRVWTLAHQAEFRGLHDLALAREVGSSDSLYGEEIPAERTRARMLAAERIVVLGDPEGDQLDTAEPEVVKRRTLEDHFEQCSSKEVTGARIMVYARPGRCSAR